MCFENFDPRWSEKKLQFDPMHKVSKYNILSQDGRHMHYSQNLGMYIEK